MGLTFDPMKTTGIADGFVLSTDGFVQGTFLDSPTNRFELEGGAVDTAQTAPLWGGLPIKLKVPAVGNNSTGPTAVIADSLGDISAYVLFNQASGGIITPSSNVPLYSAGMSINFARPGSNMRIVLPLKAADLAGLVGAAPDVALYWDPTNLYVTVTSTSNYGPLPVQLEFLSNSSKTVSYNSGTGNATWVDNGTAVVVRI